MSGIFWFSQSVSKLPCCLSVVSGKRLFVGMGKVLFIGVSWGAQLINAVSLLWFSFLLV